VITEEVARKAAEWWADRVCAPQFNGLSAKERAAGGNAGYELAEVMASMLAGPVTASSRATFIEILTMRILKDQPCGLWVDYHPDNILARVGEMTGIPSDNWPWKTGVSFRDGGAWVKEGYGDAGHQL
jgi:hypothetical protein